MNKLELYLRKTSLTTSFKIFIHPVTLKDVSIQKLRLSMCKFIRLGDPSAFPRTHDLRKLASSFAFLKSMSSAQLCKLVGWASIKVFKRHYLKQIGEVSASFIALGSKVKGKNV